MIDVKHILGYAVVGFLVLGICTIVSAHNPVVTNGLVSHWEMEEGSGNTTVDSVGSNDGTFANFTTGGDLPTWSTDVAGAGSTYSISFNTASGGQVVRNTSPTGTNTDGKTVGLWVKAIGLQNQEVFLFSNAVAGGGVGWMLRLVDNGTKWDYGHYGIVAITSTAVDINKWHYVVATKEATTANLYIDGVLAYSNTITGYNSSTEDLTIGCAQGDETVSSDELGLNGLIDEVTFYNRALTAEEVLQNYNAMQIIKCPTTDLTNDCYVDFRDLAAMAADWLVCGWVTGDCTF
ncbi:MAG: LamG domain-containing protein [Phycisphaerae bacterium]|jgi:hypothetical protein